jgi:TRAP-type uncharacterized transport system substrate-binding protein
MIESFYTTGNQRLAVALATIGIAPHSNPVTVERSIAPNGDPQIRTTFHFETEGLWTGFGGQPQIAIKADAIAAAYFAIGRRRPQPEIDFRILAELQIIHACLEVRDEINRVRKAANPEHSYIGVAICENATTLSSFAAASQELTRQKLRRGILYAPTETLHDAIKLFKQFT